MIQKHKNQQGFTLIEVILALALLGIVSLLMTPVLASAYRQVAYSGDRSLVEKELTGNAENVFAGGTPDITAGEFPITISTTGSPGDTPISVNADKVPLESDSKLGQSSINLYDPTEIPFFNRPIDFNNVSISTVGWNSASKDGVYVDLGSLAAEYDGRIKYALYNATTNSVIISETIYTGTNPQIPLDNLESSISYNVELVEIANPENKLVITIPRAPHLKAVAGSGNKTYIKIDRDHTGIFSDLLETDMIRYSTTIDGSYTSLISSSVSVATSVANARTYFFRTRESSYTANTRNAESIYVHPE